MHLIQGDIHKIIKELPDNTYNLLYTNPPFNSLTGAKWDTVLNWNELFDDIWRIMKPNGIVVLHSSQRFTIELCAADIKNFKYKYIWKKECATNFLACKYQPLRVCEDICVFYKKAGTYNPQMIGDTEYKYRKNGFGTNQNYYKTVKDQKIIKQKESHNGRFPNDLLIYKRNIKGAGTRPDDLIDFIIKTYSNEGDEVLDITCYDYRSGLRCLELNRHYTGIDLNIVEKY